MIVPQHHILSLLVVMPILLCQTGCMLVFGFPETTSTRLRHIHSTTDPGGLVMRRKMTMQTLPMAVSKSSLQARSICIFDETDFTGSAGETSALESVSFNRLDTSDDSQFYNEPRFVNHIDDTAIQALKTFYENEFESAFQDRPLDILDLCSSWTSHYPEQGSWEYGRIVGLGMNQEELDANPLLTERIVHDLNRKPRLDEYFPQDGCFDIVTMAVSVDYLVQPLPVFQEIHRLLRPGSGMALISFSNRCFPTKAIATWLQADDLDRLTLVASYFHYAAKGWSILEALDLKDAPQELPKRPSAREMFANPAVGLAWMNSAAAVQKNNAADPMFIVKGVKE